MKLLQCVARALVLFAVVNTASLGLDPGGLRAQQTASSPPAATQTNANASDAARPTIGGKMTPAKLIRWATPAYPRKAKAAMIEGTVVLHGVIETDGIVDGIKLVSGPPALVQSAIDCVKKWKYQPTTLNGKPVKVATDISVAFRLKP